MTAGAIGDHRARWREKPVLRAIYEDFYRRIAAACVPGRTLEIGGGSGNFKAHAPEVLSSDVQPVPWLDLVADAHALPVAAASLANIVGVDVLHHLHRPRLFFAEAARVLRPGGRVVLVEPAITPVSWPVYRYLHPEPVRLGDDPLIEGPADPGHNPYDANQAVPTTLFGRHLGRFHDLFPQLRLVARRRLGLVAYPLSGGFRRWSLMPTAAVGPLLRLEDALAPALGALMAFRMFLVVERRP